MMTIRWMLKVAVVCSVTVACGGSSVVQDSESNETRTQSRIDYTDQLASCLERAGLRVERDTPVSFDVHADSMTDAQLRATIEECKNAVGPEPERVVDEASAVRVYERFLQTTECLEHAGYQPDPPPSREAFIESYLLGDPNWHPFGSWSDALSLTEFERLQAECPSWVT